MADIAVENTASKPESVSTPKKAKVTKSSAASKVKKSDHPATSEMVLTAIRDLKEPKGSSLQAIKKFISSNFGIDEKKFAPFIRKYLAKAAETGVLVRTKGHGASGSFKIPEAPKAKVSSSVKRVAKKASSGAAKSPAKKSTPKKKIAAVKKSAAKPKKSPKKAKKVAAPAESAAAAEATTSAAATTVAASARKAKKAVKASAPSKSVAKSKKSGGSPAAKPKAPKPKTIKAKKSTPTKKK